MTAYMLDSNVFDRLTDGQVSIDAFRGLRLVATHIQLDELSAAKEKYPERAAELLRTFEKIDQMMSSTKSAVWDVSKWDQSSYSAEDGVVENMLARLRQLDAEAGKKHRDQKNPIRDVLIAHTAININATLISDDEQLRELVLEYGGQAIPPSSL
jgi:predicted nucleic acid-binding protein